MKPPLKRSAGAHGQSQERSGCDLRAIRRAATGGQTIVQRHKTISAGNKTLPGL
ncbi:MAG: hypothetical protein HY023_08060 [Chloroflexi bacterium]|nr:hypothetical protein [Chloroflexota bacterium]